MQPARTPAPLRTDQVDPELQRESDEWWASDIGQAWFAEIQRRVADRKAGRTQSVPHDEVMAIIRADLARLRACR